MDTLQTWHQSVLDRGLGAGVEFAAIILLNALHKGRVCATGNFSRAVTLRSSFTLPKCSCRRRASRRLAVRMRINHSQGIFRRGIETLALLRKERHQCSPLRNSRSLQLAWRFSSAWRLGLRPTTLRIGTNTC